MEEDFSGSPTWLRGVAALQIHIGF